MADIDREDFTADGQPIREGLRCWDSNLDAGTVIEFAREAYQDMRHGVPTGGPDILWHAFKRDSDGRVSSSDGSRLAVVHPFTRERVPDRPASDQAARTN